MNEALTSTPPAAPEAGAPPQPRRTLGQRIARGRWGYAFVAPFFLLFAIFGLYPLVFSILLSFNKWNGRGDMVWNGLGNYAVLLKDTIFWQSMKNGVILFFMYVPLMTFLALVLAVILNSRRVRGFRLFRMLIFLPYITNMAAAGITFRLLLNTKYGLVNDMLGQIGLGPVPWLDTIWGSRVTLCLLIIWAWLGYNMVIMLAGLQTIPGELNEAALIDGANRRQAFFYITVPLMRPTILFSVILSTIGSFGLFTEVVALSAPTSGSMGGGPQNAILTPIIAIFNQAFGNFQFGYASAMAYVYFACLFVLTIVQMRYFSGERDKSS